MTSHANETGPAVEAEEMTAEEMAAEEVLCETCGQTVGMVCPECPGCGCHNGRCSGWRHEEHAYEEDDPDPDEHECDCGASHEYHCVCG